MSPFSRLKQTLTNHNTTKHNNPEDATSIAVKMSNRTPAKSLVHNLVMMVRKRKITEIPINESTNGNACGKKLYLQKSPLTTARLLAEIPRDFTTV